MRSVPFFVEDGGGPYRPAVVLWVEAPSGLIVGQEMLDPGEVEGAVGRVLVSALARPLAGAQPAPDAVRVGDAELAGEVRAVLGGEVPIEIAPTPEIDEVLEAFLEAMPNEESEERSYLDGGRIEPHAVERLFAAARLLHEAAPWRPIASSSGTRSGSISSGMDELWRFARISRVSKVMQPYVEAQSHLNYIQKGIL